MTVQTIRELDSHSPTAMPVATGRRPATKTLGIYAEGDAEVHSENLTGSAAVVEKSHSPEDKEQRLTILEVTGKHVATKVHTRLEDGSWDTQSHSRSVNNKFREAPVSDVYTLANVIRGLTQREYLIRGEFNVSLTGQTGRRKIYFRATLKNFGGHRGATPCQWMMVDHSCPK